MFDLNKYKLIKSDNNVYVPQTTSEWLELINDVAIDYDGCNTIESLKELINEIRAYAIFAKMALIKEKEIK